MRKLLFAALAIIACSGSRAEDSQSSYNTTADFTFTTQYFFRGVKNQDAAFQPSVTYNKGAFSAGVWSSQALRQRSEQWANGREYDAFANYSISITEKYSVTLGGTYYAYPSARPSFDEPRDSYEASLAVEAPIGPLNSKFSVFRDFALKANTVQADIGYALDIHEAAIEFGAYCGQSRIADSNGSLPGNDRFDYEYVGVDVTVSKSLSKHTTVKIGGHWTDTSGDQPSPSNKCSATLSIVWSF